MRWQRVLVGTAAALLKLGLLIVLALLLPGRPAWLAAAAPVALAALAVLVAAMAAVAAWVLRPKKRD